EGLIGGMFLMLSYFGCDQSQVQRYLSGSSLTQSRLSLLFNAFVKVPMQFLILLTGVLVFVFYHFHEPPLLWNSVQMRRLQAETPPAEMAALQDRYRTALAARRDAAEAYARERDAAVQARYLAAVAQVDAVRGEARERIEHVTGARYNDTNYIFPT